MGARGITAALVVASLAHTLPVCAQSFDLATCRVAVSDGALVKLDCGGVTYWVVGRERAAECAGWKRDCPVWETRSALLDEALAKLRRGQLLLDESTRAVNAYRERVDVLSVQVDDLEADLRSQWSTLEIVGVAAIVLVGGFVAGGVVGVFAL